VWQRKLAVKLAQRIGLTFLPPRVVKWRYKRGHRSLTANLRAATGALPVTPAEVSPPAPKEEEEEEEDDAALPASLQDRCEMVIELLLSGLRDRDTMVRWSAAKGVGRVTARLPRAFADDVVSFVTDLFNPCEVRMCSVYVCVFGMIPSHEWIHLPERWSLAWWVSSTGGAGAARAIIAFATAGHCACGIACSGIRRAARCS
jgi:hypothetical protein